MYKKDFRLLSMNRVSTPELSFEQVLRIYQKVGYTAAGITFDDINEYGVDNAKQLISETKMTITHICFLGPFNQMTERDYQVARSEDIKKIKIAEALGIRCILALTGPPNDLSEHMAEGQLIRSLTDLANHINKTGIKVGLEPIHYMYRHEWTYLHTLAKTLEIIDIVDQPYLGVFFDMYHLWQEPGLLDLIQNATGKIVGCHINDWRPITRSLSDRTFMGEGCIPLKEIIYALEKAGWDEWFDVEIISEELSKMEPIAFLQTCRKKYNELWD